MFYISFQNQWIRLVCCELVCGRTRIFYKLNKIILPWTMCSKLHQIKNVNFKVLQISRICLKVKEFIYWVMKIVNISRDFHPKHKTNWHSKWNKVKVKILFPCNSMHLHLPTSKVYYSRFVFFFYFYFIVLTLFKSSAQTISRKQFIIFSGSNCYQ